MSKHLSSRVRILIGLVIVSIKVSLDLVFNLSTTHETQKANEEAVVFQVPAVVDINSTNDALPIAINLHAPIAETTLVTLSGHITDREMKSVSAANETSLASGAPTVSTGFETRKYAYAYVIGGCNPENGHYKGFLYNIMVSTRILQEQGARADVIALFQISHKSNATALPEGDVRLLTALGVKIEYIPKSEIESFYDTVMNKFRILALTQYRRILLMDGDVMPLGNLDFLFEMSDGPNATIMENVIVMGMMEPANAGFFMLAPGDGEYERLLDIVRTREVEAANLTTWPKFDETKGWGTVIEEDDQWESRRGLGGTKWNFHFAFSDQGLLFHWAKYVKRKLSIVHGHGGVNQMVQNWSPSSPSGKAVLKERLSNPFDGRSNPLRGGDCVKFMCDFQHFTGSKKPWMSKPPADLGFANFTVNDDATRLWWKTLYVLNDELKMSLDFTKWTSHKPPLGLYATFHDVERRIVKRKEESNQTVTDK